MRHLHARRREATATPHFTFTSDGTPQGDQAVADMQAVSEADYATYKGYFGQPDPPALPAQITVDPNAGGAYHYSCDGTQIFLIPDDAPTLLVAEMTEVFMAFSQGWSCGQTNGEGLSRALAEDIRPAQVLTGLDGDVSGWWASGPQDFVNDNSATDQDQNGNACGTLFLWWLRYQLGFSWNQIIAAGASTLGETYKGLTGDSGQNGFQKFVADCRSAGVPNVPQSGNPFPVGTPSPQPQPSPPPTPSPAPAPTPPPTKCPFVKLILKSKRIRRELGY